MSESLQMPDPERINATIDRSRRRRLDLELVALELEETIALLERENKKRWIEQRKQSLDRQTPIDN